MSDIHRTQAESTVQAPDDFQQYQAWRQSGGETAAAPAEPSSEVAVEPAAKTDPDSETGDDQEQQDDAQPRKGKGGFQRRIDRLTREKLDLEARLAAVERNAGGEPAARSQEPAPAPKAEAPRLEDFDDYNSYTEALTDWKVDQKLDQRMAQEQQKVSASRAREREAQAAAKFQERAQAATAKYPDFAEVTYSDDVPLSPVMREAVLESEHGADLAYWLGSHVEDAVRIAQLPPTAAARELGRIEASFAQATPAAVPKEKPKFSRAPEPIRPLSSAAKSVSNDVLDPAFAEDYSAWKKTRMAQLQRK